MVIIQVNKTPTDDLINKVGKSVTVSTGLQVCLHKTAGQWNITVAIVYCYVQDDETRTLSLKLKTKL